MVVIFFSLALTPAQLTTAITIDRYRLLLGWIITLLLPAGVWAAAMIRRKDENSG
jgi:hypothetical protein